jgi:hypothetical protein
LAEGARLSTRRVPGRLGERKALLSRLLLLWWELVEERVELMLKVAKRGLECAVASSVWLASLGKATEKIARVQVPAWSLQVPSFALLEANSGRERAAEAGFALDSPLGSTGSDACC